MKNVINLSGNEVDHLKPAIPTDNSSLTERPKSVVSTKLSLDVVLQDFNDWRANKKHSGAAIPDELWDKVFDLAILHSPTTLCGLLGISKPQYKKQKTLRDAKEKKQENAVPEPSSSSLCHVKVVPQKSSYQPQPLPSAKTLVVELCRRDGQVMKIHTTQDSIDNIIHSFLSEVKV